MPVDNPSTPVHSPISNFYQNNDQMYQRDLTDVSSASGRTFKWLVVKESGRLTETGLLGILKTMLFGKGRIATQDDIQQFIGVAKGFKDKLSVNADAQLTTLGQRVGLSADFSGTLRDTSDSTEQTALPVLHGTSAPTPPLTAAPPASPSPIAAAPAAQPAASSMTAATASSSTQAPRANEAASSATQNEQRMRERFGSIHPNFEIRRVGDQSVYTAAQGFNIVFTFASAEDRSRVLEQINQRYPNAKPTNYDWNNPDTFYLTLAPNDAAAILEMAPAAYDELLNEINLSKHLETLKTRLTQIYPDQKVTVLHPTYGGWLVRLTPRGDTPESQRATIDTFTHQTLERFSRDEGCMSPVSFYSTMERLRKEQVAATRAANPPLASGASLTAQKQRAKKLLNLISSPLEIMKARPGSAAAAAIGSAGHAIVLSFHDEWNKQMVVNNLAAAFPDVHFRDNITWPTVGQRVSPLTLTLDDAARFLGIQPQECDRILEQMRLDEHADSLNSALSRKYRDKEVSVLGDADDGWKVRLKSTNGETTEEDVDRHSLRLDMSGDTFDTLMERLAAATNPPNPSPSGPAPSSSAAAPAAPGIAPTGQPNPPPQSTA